MSITTKLVGGLGNQLFQIANCIAFSMRHNMAFEIPVELDKGYNKYGTYFNHFPPPVTRVEDFGIYREPSFTYAEIPRKEQICFIGYFQSWKYFDDYKDQVFKMIMEGFTNIFPRDIDLKYDYKIAVHVRRGDYIEYSDEHPPVTMEYLRKAIFHFYNKGYHNFSIYSDDIKWCKENLPKNVFFVASQANFSFMESEGLLTDKQRTMLDFYTMSKHAHQIISNSTFSLWAAMLNSNPDKIVICPDESNWFGKNTIYDAKDILPKDYLRIKY